MCGLALYRLYLPPAALVGVLVDLPYSTILAPFCPYSCSLPNTSHLLIPCWGMPTVPSQHGWYILGDRQARRAGACPWACRNIWDTSTAPFPTTIPVWCMSPFPSMPTVHFPSPRFQFRWRLKPATYSISRTDVLAPCRAGGDSTMPCA